jgi:glycosyltransferase involved in cell wall biosynthesis
MSFIIIGEFTFPDGSAATNRVYYYAKGFIENGIDTHVISFVNRYDSPQDGKLDNIKFYTPFGQTKRSKYFFVRSWLKFIKYIKTFIVVRDINKKDEITVFICYLRVVHWQLFAFILAKIFRSTIILERNEHPLRGYQDTHFNLLKGKTKLYFDRFLFQGILCISRYLVEFYQGIGVNPQSLFLVPSTIDPGRLNITSSSPFEFKYVGYFGGLTFERDNIDNLIKAFVNISNIYPDIKLVLGGFYKSEVQKEQLMDLIINLELTSKVIVLNYMSRQDIINYVLNSYILVMVRKEGFESSASFPSKLPEYLATGKPVISVNVGEISEFISDGENAFLIEPGNVDALTEKISFVIENYNLAKKVAEKGKELTNTTFNYNFQARRIINFVNSINNHPVKGNKK